MTPPTNIAKKESLERDFNTLNSSFQLDNTSYFSQKCQKQHFVMLLLSLRKEQHKYFLKGPYFSKNKNIKIKGLIFVLFSFS